MSEPRFIIEARIVDTESEHEDGGYWAVGSYQKTTTEELMETDWEEVTDAMMFMTYERLVPEVEQHLQTDTNE